MRGRLPLIRGSVFNFIPVARCNVCWGNFNFPLALINDPKGQRIQTALVPAALTGFDYPAAFQQLVDPSLQRPFGLPAPLFHDGVRRAEIAIVASVILVAEFYQQSTGICR